MRHVFRVLSAVLVLALLLPIGGVYGQEYRADLKASPLEVCKDITASAEKGEFKDLLKSLEPIDPVLASLKQKYGVDIKKDVEAAVTAKDKGAVAEAAWKLAFFDMKELLEAIVENKQGRSGTLLKGWHKIAYIDYLYLSEEVAKRSYKPEGKDEKEEKGTLVDSRIKRLFRAAYFALGKTSPYKKTTTKADLETYTKIGSAIVAECLKVFPEFDVKKPAEEKVKK